MWWHVWSNHPTSTILCGCGDTSQFVWFLKWPAYALSHGLNPFYSTAASYPHGVNLLSVTSVLAVGILFAPITWIFGPIATLNVALLLSPVLSGVAMFILLRRWVSWDPAAFIGGLLYGFSPIILTSLYFSHLNLTISPIPPLVVACLDEIVMRQRRRPVVTGVLLGLLVTLQILLEHRAPRHHRVGRNIWVGSCHRVRRVAEASGLTAACPLRRRRSGGGGNCGGRPPCLSGMVCARRTGARFGPCLAQPRSVREPLQELPDPESSEFDGVAVRVRRPPRLWSVPWARPGRRAPWRPGRLAT